MARKDMMKLVNERLTDLSDNYSEEKFRDHLMFGVLWIKD